MSGFRDKFQGAKLSANKDVQKEAAENNKTFSNGNSRASFHNVDEGRNVFRILPVHPDSTIKATYLPKRVTMLKCEVEQYENGEPTGKTEVKNKNVFIATQHSSLPKDPVELYIDYVRKYADDAFDDKTERQKYLYPITGWSDKKGWHWGIAPRTTFVTYAIKNGQLGRLELYESWIKEMDKLAIAGEEAGDVINVDPFSDPDEGFPLIITKQKAVDKNGKETGKWEYVIEKDIPSMTKRESWPDFFKRTRVTDEQLEEFIKQEPLSALYGNDVYTRRDWDLAMDGLKRFDEENKYQIFENEDFLQEIMELEKLVPEAKESTKETDSKLEKTFEEEKTKEESLETSIPEMKMELKRFIKKMYGEEYIDQIPFSKPEVQKWYSLMEEGEELPIKVGKDPEPEVKKITPKEPEVVSTEGSLTEDDLKAQIDKLRNRNR